MSSVYIPGQPPLLEAAAARDTKFGAYFDALPETPAGHATKFVRVNSAANGLELVASLLTLVRTPLWISADATLNDSNLAFDLVGTTLYDRTIIVRHTTPSNNVILTLPNNTTAGKYWVIRQAATQTGQVRLRPSSGATLQGGTADLRLTGPYATATVECVSNDTGSAAVYYVDGAVTSV